MGLVGHSEVSLLYFFTLTLYRGIIEPLKENYKKFKQKVYFVLSYLSISSISTGMAMLRSMTYWDLFLLIFTTLFWTICGFGFGIMKIGFGLGRLLLFLMRGEPMLTVKKKDDDKMPSRRRLGKINIMNIITFLVFSPWSGQLYTRIAHYILVL